MVSLRLYALLTVAVLFVAACGGGGVAPPPPSGTGTVTGTVTVAALQALAAAVGNPVPARPLRQSLNRPVYVPDRLMVKFRSGVAASAAAAVHQRAQAMVVRTIERLDVQVVRLAAGVSAEAAMAAYRGSGLVEYVERVGYAYRMITPNDPMYSSQWHYPQINLPQAWDVTTGGAVIVAVLDTGIRFDHPDLGGVTVTGYDFFDDDSNPTDPGCPNIDPSDPSHGTHVSGTVAARTNNGIGVAGVNWGGVAQTKIMPLRVLGEDPPDFCGVGTYDDIADAITHAADKGAKVINMSLGGSEGNTTVDNAITYARNRGVTLVAAAGNDSCGPVSYPARNSQVIAVAATTNTNQRASYSNCGPELDVAAPGGSSAAGVLSTTWSPSGGHTYLSFQGTSMATPHVAGLVALMISRGFTSPTTIQAQLESTATGLGAPGKDNEFGAGLVNAALAISGGPSAGRMRAFSGLISGTTISVQSNVVFVQSNGTFTITAAQAGTKSVFAWQDFNGNGVIDAGDYYGRTDGVVITDGGMTSGVAVTVNRYTGPTITPMGIMVVR